MKTTGVPLSETEWQLPGSGGTTVADRVADVLLLFTRGRPELGVSEISRRLGVSKAVVHRILQSLASRDLVRHAPDEHGYRLGPAAALLGAHAPLPGADVRAVARPVLRRLRDRTGETSTLSQLIGGERVYVEQFESPLEIKMTVALGVRHPLYAGATGKAILASLAPAERDRLLSTPLAALTPATVTDAEALRAELAGIAEQGVAWSLGERLPDAGSVAAPIVLRTGPGSETVYGAISLCGPLYRFNTEAARGYLPLVRDAAAEISQALSRAGTTWHKEFGTYEELGAQ